MKENYNKPPFSTEDILNKLEQEGFSILNKEEAKHFLTHVSYYRLKAYIFPLKRLSNPKFEDIIKYYRFDSELRYLLAKAIEQIEISIRALLINTYSIKYGSNWYENNSLFVDLDKHTIILEKISESLNKKPKELFIDHYYNKYNSPQNPPSWMTLEVISFGTLSHIFRQLEKDNTKKNIAKTFGIPASKTLQSWLHTFVYIRNIIAHHGRIWNKTLHIKPEKIKNPHNKWIETKGIRSDRLYLSISCIQYMLNAISPNNNFSIELKRLLQSNPSINTYYMGFPSDWQQQPLWK